MFYDVINVKMRRYRTYFGLYTVDPMDPMLSRSHMPWLGGVGGIFKGRQMGHGPLWQKSQS